MTASPESTPLRRATRNWRRGIWISLGVVIVPPMIGLGNTVVKMIGAFNRLSDSGQADPSVLADDLSFSLVATANGLVLSLLGLVTLVICVVCYFRARKALREAEAALASAAGDCKNAAPPS